MAITNQWANIPYYTTGGTWTNTPSVTWYPMIQPSQVWYTPAFVPSPTWTATTLRQQWEAEIREKEQASVRAEALLKSCLTKAEKKVWRDRAVIIIYTKGGKKYRIRKGAVYNVDEMEGRSVKAYLCARPEGDIPVCDIVLGQYLALKYNEKHFLATANRSLRTDPLEEHNG